MLRLLAKLLLFVAVLVAPLGMTAAPAAPGHHGMGAAMAMDPCPDRDEGQKETSGVADCTMACAAALPALDSTRRGDDLQTSSEPVARVLAQRLPSVHPEIATPPPKDA